jgi:hypothetical protein
MLFKEYLKVRKFPKKERTKSPSPVPHTFRHFYILTFVLCSKYMWICFILTITWNLDSLTKVTAVVDIEIVNIQLSVK